MANNIYNANAGDVSALEQAMDTLMNLGSAPASAPTQEPVQEPPAPTPAVISTPTSAPEQEQELTITPTPSPDLPLEQLPEGLQVFEPQQIPTAEAQVRDPRQEERAKAAKLKYAANLPQTIKDTERKIEYLENLLQLPDTPTNQFTGLELISSTAAEEELTRLKELHLDLTSPIAPERVPISMLPDIGAVAHLIPAQQLQSMAEHGIGAMDVRILEDVAYKAYKRGDLETFTRYAGYIATNNVLNGFRGAMQADKTYADKDAAADMLSQFRQSSNFAEAVEAERYNITKYISSKDFNPIHPIEWARISALDSFVDNAQFYNPSMVETVGYWAAGGRVVGKLGSTLMRALPYKLAHKIAGFFDVAFGGVSSTSMGVQMHMFEGYRKELTDLHPDSQGLINTAAFALSLPVGVFSDYAVYKAYGTAYTTAKKFWYSPTGPASSLEALAQRAMLTHALDNPITHQGYLRDFLATVNREDALFIGAYGSLPGTVPEGQSKYIFTYTRPKLELSNVAPVQQQPASRTLQDLVAKALKEVEDPAQVAAVDLTNLYYDKTTETINNAIMAVSSLHLASPVRNTVEQLSKAITPMYTGVANASKLDNMFNGALRSLYSETVVDALTEHAAGKTSKVIANSPVFQHAIFASEQQGIDLLSSPEALAAIADDLISADRRLLTNTVQAVDLVDGKLVYTKDLVGSETELNLRTVPDDIRQAILLSQWGKQIDLGTDPAKVLETLRGLSTDDRLFAVQAASIGVPESAQKEWAANATDVATNMTGNIPVVTTPATSASKAKPTKAEMVAAIKAGDTAVTDKTLSIPQAIKDAFNDAEAMLRREIYGEPIDVDGKAWYPRFEERIRQGMKNFEPVLDGIIARARNTEGSTQLTELELARVVDPDGYFETRPDLLKELAASGVGGLSDARKQVISYIISREAMEKSAESMIENYTQFYAMAQGFTSSDGAAGILLQRYKGYAKIELAKYLDNDPTSFIHGDAGIKEVINARLDTAAGVNIVDDPDMLADLGEYMMQTDMRKAVEDAQRIGIARKSSKEDPFSIVPSSPAFKMASFLVQRKENMPLLAPTAQPSFTPPGPINLAWQQQKASRPFSMKKAQQYYDYDATEVGIPFMGILDDQSLSTRTWDPEAAFWNKYQNLPFAARYGVSLPSSWRNAGELVEQTVLNLDADGIAKPLVDPALARVEEQAAVRFAQQQVEAGRAPDYVKRAMEQLQGPSGQGAVAKNDLAHLENGLSEGASRAYAIVEPVFNPQLSLDESITAVDSILRHTDTVPNAEYRALAKLREELVRIENAQQARHGRAPDTWADDFVDDLGDSSTLPGFDLDPELAGTSSTSQTIQQETFDAGQIASMQRGSSSYLDELSDEAAATYSKLVLQDTATADDVAGMVQDRIELKENNTIAFTTDRGVVEQQVSPEIYENFKKLKNEVGQFTDKTGSVDTSAQAKREARETIRRYRQNYLLRQDALKPPKSVQEAEQKAERMFESNMRKWLEASIDNMEMAEVKTAQGQILKANDTDTAKVKDMLKAKAMELWQGVSKQYPEASVRDRARMVMGQLYNLAESSKTSMANWGQVSKRLGISAEEASQIERFIGEEGPVAEAAKAAVLQAYKNADEPTRKALQADIDAIVGDGIASDLSQGYPATRLTPRGSSELRPEYATETYSQTDMIEAYTWYMEKMSRADTEYDQLIQHALRTRDASMAKIFEAQDVDKFMTILNMQNELATRVGDRLNTRLAFEDLYTDPKAKNILATAKALDVEQTSFLGTQFEQATRLSYLGAKDFINGTNKLERNAYRDIVETVRNKMNTRFGEYYDLPTTEELLNPADFQTVQELTERSIRGYTEALQNAGAPEDLIVRAREIAVVQADTGGFRIEVPEEIINTLNRAPGAFQLRPDADEGLEELSQLVNDKAMNLIVQFTDQAGLNFPGGIKNRYGDLRANAFLMRPRKLTSFVDMTDALVDKNKLVNRAYIDRSMREMGLLGLDKKHESISMHAAQGLVDTYTQLSADTLRIARTAHAKAHNSATANPLSKDSWNTLNASMTDVIILRRNIAMMQGIKETIATGSMSPDTFKIISALEVDPSSLSGMLNTMLRAANNVSPDWVRHMPIEATLQDAQEFARNATLGSDLTDILRENQKTGQQILSTDFSIISALQDPANAKNFSKNLDYYMEFIRTSMRANRLEAAKRTALEKRGMPIPAEQQPSEVRTIYQRKD